MIDQASNCCVFLNSDGAGMSPHVMQYQQPSHFPMAGSQQVFVFSTRMANQAAQAIYTGQADSILSYHRSQAAHRDYLHPEQVTSSLTFVILPCYTHSGLGHHTISSCMMVL